MDREDEILEMLKGLADEDIEIPDSLQPERIKEKLLKEDASREIKGRKTMKHWMVGSMAAVGAVAAAFAVMINTGDKIIKERPDRTISNARFKMRSLSDKPLFLQT